MIKIKKLIYVYLLQSEKDSNYYIGSTKNVEKRLQRHNNGRVISTKGRLPFNLVGFLEFENDKAGKYYEYKVKHSAFERGKFLKSLGIG